MLDIIIAHSDEEIRNLFYKTFTDLGYTAATTRTHKEIIDLLAKERPSHIILDAAISDIPAETMLKKITLIEDNINVLVAPRDKKALQFVSDIIRLIINKQLISLPQEEPQNTSLKIKILVVDDELASTELIKIYWFFLN